MEKIDSYDPAADLQKVLKKTFFQKITMQLPENEFLGSDSRSEKVLLYDAK
jgi:hypothetical protein